MQIIEVQALSNGAHRNQSFPEGAVLPEGWALIPADLAIPESFPFVEVEVAEEVRTREVRTTREVTKTEEVPAIDERGNVLFDEVGEPILVVEEYTEEELVVEQEEYTVLVVTELIEGVKPEPAPEPALTPTVWDELDAAYQEGVNEV